MKWHYTRPVAGNCLYTCLKLWLLGNYKHTHTHTRTCSSRSLLDPTHSEEELALGNICFCFRDNMMTHLSHTGIWCHWSQSYIHDSTITINSHFIRRGYFIKCHFISQQSCPKSGKTFIETLKWSNTLNTEIKYSQINHKINNNCYIPVNYYHLYIVMDKLFYNYQNIGM